MATRILKKQRTRNRQGYVSLVEYTEEGRETSYGVRDPDTYEYDTEVECRTLAEAEIVFKRVLSEWNDVPNWDLQERYDEEHGTDNGW